MSGRYRTIVADPPWDYGADAARQPQWNTGAEGVTRRPMPYRALSIDAIEALPVYDYADRDARLFLWTTNRFLHAAFHVIPAWGFEYRQTLVWHKTHGPSPWGGSVAPNHAEFLLVAVHGQPEGGRLASSVIAAPRQSHSVKPEAFLDLIEQISVGPYLELFARRQRLGWDTWGNEALEHVTLAEARQ